MEYTWLQWKCLLQWVWSFYLWGKWEGVPEGGSHSCPSLPSVTWSNLWYRIVDMFLLQGDVCGLFKPLMLFFGINLLLPVCAHRCLFSERRGCVHALRVSTCVMCCCCTEDLLSLGFCVFRLGMSVCSVCLHVWCVMWACPCPPCVYMCDVLRGYVHGLHVSTCVMCYIQGLGLSFFRLAPTHLLWGIWVSSISTVVYSASGSHATFVSTMTSWLLSLCCGCKIWLPLSTWVFLFFSYIFMVSYKQGM